MVSELSSFVRPKSMASANKLVRLKYSCEEVYERMEKGLCIFCEELDIPGHHQLKHKGIQIFMTECYGDQVSEDKEEAHLETVTNPNPSVETVTNLEPFVETMKHASVLQVPGSVSDVFLVHRVDYHVKEVEELPQESTNSNEKNVAHRVFDKMPLAVTSKEKQRKSLKAWKFKFKISFKRSKLMDDMFSFVEETAWLNRDPKEKIWDCVKKEFKETMAACGKKTIDRLKLVDETSKPAAYDRTFQIRVWDGGGSLLECVLWRRLKHYQRYGHEMQAIEAEMTIPLAKETQDWTVNALFKTQVFYDFDIASWIGLEIYFGCETKRHMLLRVKLANRMWERGELLATHAYCKWLESCYVRDRVLKYCFLLEMPFAEFIEIKACRKELSVAGLSQLSLASDGKSNEEVVTVLAARPQLFNTFLRICEYNKVDNPWVCNDRQKGAVCDAGNKKLQKLLLDDVLRVMVCWNVHNRICEAERKIYISGNQNSRNQELPITYRFLMIGKFSWSKRLNETCCFLLEKYFDEFVGCNAHGNETQNTNQSHGTEGSKSDIQDLESGHNRIVLKLKLPLSSGADLEQLFKWVNIHFSDNQKQEGLLSFPWELMLANLKENHACGVDTRFLEPDRYEFIWWVSSTCEADHISSETFSVGAVHGFFTGSKLQTGDETQEKRLLFLNNHNKVDPTVKENWFYNEPMIRGVFHLQRGVFHLQRPPELFDLPGNLDFITKVLVQWKEHPPDQFFSGFYRQVLMLSSLRTRMF